MVKYKWNDLRQRIFEEAGYIETESNFLFSTHTTIGTGGRASAFFPASEEKLVSLIKALKKLNAKYYILGGGSNVLPPKSEYTGVIVSTLRLKGVFRLGNTVKAFAGERFSSLINFAVKNNLSFCEFMAGVPATVGGAVYMNAGVSERHISDVIKSVRYTDGISLFDISSADCRFGYKDSLFMHISPCAIISAEFFAESNSFASEEVKRFISLRKNLPTGKSMGCVFKNPAGMYAGKIIEASGLKGMRIGGAEVSPRHANFIINADSATSADISSLINHVKRVVYKKTGIALKEEIKYIR